MPLPYDFKSASRDLPRRNNSKYKRLRFFAVLLIVAAITVAVVMLIIPDKKEINKENPAAEQTVSPENKNTPDVIDVPENNNGNSTDSESGNSSTTGNSDGNDAPRNGGDTNTATNGNSGSSVEENHGPGGNSGGSQLESWYSKNSRVIDDGSDEKPRFRAAKSAAAEALYQQLKSMTSPDEVIAQAAGFLMKENASGGVYSENWQLIGSCLTAAVQTKFANRNWKQGGKVIRVTAGNNLTLLARKHSTTIEGIKFINRKKDNTLRIGEKLTVIPGDWKISVSKSARLLNLWRKVSGQWQIFAVFPVGIGRKNSTPAGEFKISIRLRNPRWHGPDGRIFPHGDKENPLGDYFLKLRMIKPVKGKTGYGIHGSPDDSSVGKSLSRGCIRMHNADVKLLYWLVPAGCTVEITE